MELKNASQILSDIAYACQEFKPENVDIDDIESWRDLTRQVHVLRTKKGDEYNFMKTIIDSHDQFLECMPTIEMPYDELNKKGKSIF